MAKETVTFRDKDGNLVTQELDDGVSYDAIAAIVIPKVKKRGPSLAPRRRALRKAIWCLLAEGGSATTAADLARKLKEIAPELSAANDVEGNKHDSLEKIIRKMIKDAETKKR